MKTAALLLTEVMRFTEETLEYLHELRHELSTSPADDAVAELDRSFAIADLLALAVFADGEISGSEWAAIEQACKRIGREGVHAEEAVNHWRRRMEEIADEEQLLAQVRKVALPLEPEARRAVYAHIERFADNGAGLPTGETSYRDFRVVDPARLLAIFAEGLEITPGESLEE